MRIVAKGLKYSYDPKSKFKSDALKGVDIVIEEGAFLGIIGRTGSGKSTFIQHLNGLLPVQKNGGELYVGDFNLTFSKKKDKKALKDLRKKVGMVFQYPEHQLFAETVFSDVAFGLKNFAPELSEEEVEERVRTAINVVGLNYFEVKDKSPFDLSGGQKRRVAIAGVIVNKPEVLVLDEPVAGLDPKGKDEFMSLLHYLKKEFVKTIIIVSHDMDLVSEHCDSVAIFSDGTVVKHGTPKEVFSSAQEMQSLGLELPLTVYLIDQLKSIGVDIDCDLTVKDFVDAITKYKTGGGL
jgi:energy-coupling factor transport system ATP-binding protein